MRCARVPDREREHAVQRVDAFLAAIGVELQDDFRVALRLERVALGDQLLPDLPVVVDLAVEDDPQGAADVGHRLVAAAEVDDAQAAMAEADVVRGPRAPNRRDRDTA